jgi:hypothetical protein
MRVSRAERTIHLVEAHRSGDPTRRTDMTTATITDHHHRPLLPFVGLFVATGALVLGVVAITADDVAPTVPAVAESADETTTAAVSADPRCEPALTARVVRC